MHLSMTRGNRDAEPPASTGGMPRTTPPSGKPPRGSAPRQREQILAAAERLLNERGSAHLGVADVRVGAGISASEFAASFAGRRELLLALFDRVAALVGRKMERAYRSQPAWVDAVRAALCELLAFLESHIEVARFLIVDSLQGDAAMLARRELAVGAVSRVIEADHPDAAASAPPFGAEALVEAAAAVLHGRLLEDPVPSLRELVGPLMGVLVMPYLDASAARDELSSPRPSTGPPSADTD
jgi:AcrR family transcriptional regulator